LGIVVDALLDEVLEYT